MISTCGHTAVSRKTSMSERQSLWGFGSKAKQITETSTENLEQTQRQQTVQPTDVGLCTVYKFRSEAKYIGGLVTFNSRFFISEVDEKITE